MIRINNYNKKKDNSRIIPTTASIFTLAIMMIATTTMATPAAATTTTTASATTPQPVSVATDNQSVNVLISWEPTVIEPGQDVEFTLDFQDPSTGESISHVNYNFEIRDQNTGEAVQSMTDLHSHSGSDEQTVTFDTTGGFNFVVTIIGIGIDPPFDTTQSGTAQTVIPVGLQVASSPTGTTANMTAATGDITAGIQSACAPTQMAVGEGVGQNATANTTTTGGGIGTSNSTTGNITTTTTATTVTTTANGTTAETGGNLTTGGSPTQLIEQACIAAQNNDTQGVLMNLNAALNALSANATTTADDAEDDDGGEEEEGEA
jgi:hypothetical protein